MKVRALFVTFIILASTIMVIFNGGQVGIAQISLLDDTPVLDESPVQDDYEFEVLSGEYAVVGVRPKVGNNNDLEIYTDNTFTTMIDSSNTAGDSVDFVSLYKDTWTGPPNRGAKVTSGSRDFVIEMENQIESHPVFDSWGGSMDEMPGNPVLDVGISGSWDDEYVSHPTVIYANGLYRMWYSGNDGGSRYKIGYATSSDGKTWSKYGGNPVLDVGTSGQWDSYRAYSPTVLYIGGTYHMWYVGYNNVGFNFRIGYATSSDGITWAKSPSNPVLNLGSGGQWDDERVYAPCVLHDGVSFQMWYSGYDGASYRIGYATSVDGESWARHPSNPILGPGPATTWDDSRVFAPSVIFNGTDYFMSYTGYDGGKYRVGYGVSQDGINWHKSPANPVLDLGQAGSWDDFQVHSPSILEDGSDTVLWYAGEDGLKTRIGYATIPIIDNWEKYSGNPVIDIGTGGQWDDFHVRTPSIIFDGTTYHMWYTGNDGSFWRIGYATSTDGINWNKYGGNPVLNLGSGWEDSGVLEPFVLFDGSTYHMWYSGDDGTVTRRIGYANSTDGITWNRYPGNPILNIGSPGEWDDDSIYPDTIRYDGLIYQMWYTGDDGPRHRIGYATSSDGLNWLKYDNTSTISSPFAESDPVMDLGLPGSWEDEHVYRPSILFDGLEYQMWYGGGDGSVIKTGYATSSDGINWHRYPGNPVIDNGPSGTFDDTHTTPFTVYYDGFTYHNWYTSRDSSTYRIGYARITFSKYETFTEVLDAYEITGVNAGSNYTIDLDVPPSLDLGLFIYDSTGGRNDAMAFSDSIGDGIDESISFTASTSGEYLLLVTNENGGVGTYTISFNNTPPIIANVTAVPDPQEVYGTVYISANITDDYELFGAWVEIRDPLGSLVGNMTLLFDPINGKYYWIQSYDVLGTFTFTIWANDTSNLWSTVSGSYAIQDTTPPLLINVTAIPDPQEVFFTVNISAIITDNYQLFGAWVEVYDPISGFIGNFSMLYDITNDRYYWIQNYDLLGTFTYTIWANDTSNNWALAPGSFVIQDTTAPIISDIIAIPDPQEVFFSVNVSANITDNYQMDGAWVQIFDPDGILIGNFTMYENTIDFRYYNNRSYDTIGPYTFTIWANDTSNNWALAPGSFVIQDTTAPIISDIIAIPDPQEVFFSVNISANITDNYEMGGAWVQIFDPNGIFIGNFTMYNNKIDLGYYYNRTYALIGTYTFTIWANDSSNNWNSESGSFLILDTTLPQIADVNAIPDPQEVYGNVNISAKITDNYQLSGVWVGVYDPLGGFIGNFSMLYDLTNDRYYWIQNYDLLGTFTFTIWANDTSNNLVSSAGLFLIWDTTPPEITDVTVVPDPQEVFSPANISAIVSDNYQTYGVWIEIDFPNGNPFGNFSMSCDSTNGRYYLERTYNLLGEYSFTIWANDTSDNWAFEMGTFIIQDTEPPIVTDVMANPDPQEVYGDVRISAKISDNFQLDGEWVEIYDSNDMFVGNFSMTYDPISDRFYHEQNYEILGQYTFTIWAKDLADNWASDYGTFVIHDTTPPIISDPITNPDPQEVYRSINISATITDNYELYGGWIEIYNPDGNSMYNITLSYDSIFERYYHLENFNSLGIYIFTIRANDTSDNWASLSGVFTVQDTTKPLILDTTAVPDPQEVFGVVNISANVTDNYELSHVWFEVRNPEGNLVANGPMQYSTSDSKYYWSQSYDTLGIFTYIIRANDTSGNLASVSGTFLIRDTTPPVISDIVIIYREPNLYKPINVSANVTDNYQLHNVWIEIIDPDGHTIENTSMKYNTLRYRFYINHTFNMSGEYAFKIHANDTSNNWATSSGVIRIEPQEDPEEYNWKPIIAFLFVIILLIIGTIIVLSHPMKFTGDLGKDRMYSFFAGVLPFVVAEAITGIISYFTGLFAIPPILGLGMIVDLGILIVGIICSIIIYIKGVPSKSYKEEITPTPTKSQPTELSSQLEGSPSPSPSPETPAPPPVPEQDEEQPPVLPPEPQEEPPHPPPL